MTEDRLRDLLHESVAGTVGPDLAEAAWRKAQQRRRRQYVATVGAAAMFVAIGAAGVRLLTPDEPTPPVGRPTHSAPRTPEPPSTSPATERPDASYLGVPVWWAPEGAAAEPADDSPVLPTDLDLSSPAPDAVEQPLGRAVAAFCDTGTSTAPADGAVRLVGPDGEQRDLDVSSLRGLAFDGVGRMSPVDRSMLSPDGRTLVFPQDDHAMLFDLPSGEWSRLDVRAVSGIRWADATTLYLPDARSGGRLVALDGTHEGRANLTDVVRPGVDLGQVSLLGPWRAAGGGAVAQTYDGRRGTVPGPSGRDVDQTYVVLRGETGTDILVLAPTDEPGWSLLAGWLDPETLVYEVVGEGDGQASLVSWRVGAHDFSLVSTVTGLEAGGHRFIGSYALGG